MNKPTQFSLLLSPSDDVREVDLYTVTSASLFGSEKAAVRAFDKVYFKTKDEVQRAAPEMWSIDDVFDRLSTEHGWFVQLAPCVRRTY